MFNTNVTVDFNTRELNLVFEDAWDDAARELEPIITNYVRRNHRYKDRTGNLTRKTTAAAVINGLSVFSTAGYAQYVAKPHGTWRGDDWIEEAINDNITLIEKTYEKHLQIHFNKMR